MERKNRVKMKGTPLTLLGPELKIGDIAPDFKVIDITLQKVSLKEFKGKKIFINVVPSIDTGVCSIQTKRFSEEASKIKDVTFLTISTDLPFAQKRFCETEKIEGMKMLCDSVWHDFGMKYGVLIKDIGLLARSIFIIDSDGKISYIQIVDELTNHPDYEAVLRELKK
ncbi:MAG TPA: thiol peroxidase [Victivallales bacterium]|nr:thiol peroxidase [Victivallales bacterium]HPO91478.1 thiol peroxidase [Victivallales bacterium]HRR28384.1 thiol peroxidase [Victivallales bacterium]HRU01343.1 thiol peroxidase [Victivallales bacterium]